MSGVLLIVARLRWRRFAQARWLSPILLLVLWEVLARAGLLPPETLAAPSSVVATFAHMIASGELPANLLVSLARAGAGLAIGIAVGVALGLAAGLSRSGEAFVDPLMQIKRTIPALALTPLFIVWFGIGETPKVVLIAFATLFPIYLNLYQGIRGADVRLIEAAQSFGLSQRQLIAHVILPAALPSLLTGVRFSLSISLLMLAVAEQINATSGIGFLITTAREFMRTDVIVVSLLVYAILGLTADAGVRAIERRVLAWRPSAVSA